jgi:hypothetical protein
MVRGFKTYSKRLYDDLFPYRAGANFSAISGGDANALRWDRLGYSHMMKLAKKHGKEACIAKTPSFEYWDEMPARGKIDSMAEYLQDVSSRSQKQPRHTLLEP